ncbi:hypothetical protein EZV62_027679 [Acer yangbiense]|uniref:Uncharacterized protein n=1 Tax=Acer yangbiense TaxID=1000413 RepID=A0A5C7GV15_9ROSI|nr:hypothetical protein EZV62_027679 [Acer yangbiense]
MVSLCTLVSRLSLVARTGATAARILKGTTVPALLNRGVEANRVIETRAFTIKSYFDGGDDCGAAAAVGNKKNNASSIHDVSPLCPSDFELLNEDLDVIIDWSRTYKDGNSFHGGRHGKMIMLKVDSKILEVPSGILPSSIKESDKEQMYKLHMEDQEVYTPEKLAKDYNTAAETVDEILSLRDALTNRYPEATERADMYRLYKEKPEIYTIERLAKNFKIARGSAHSALFTEHVREYILQPKSSTSDGQEIPRLPFTRQMKDDWARWSANSNAYQEDVEVCLELFKKYKKLLPPEYSDDEVLKFMVARLTPVEE